MSPESAGGSVQLAAVDGAQLLDIDTGSGSVTTTGALGATTALTAASLVPDRIKAVVYSDPPLFNHNRPRKDARERFQGRLDMILAE